MSKRIDVSKLTPVVGTFYPPPYDKPCRGRKRLKLGDAAGLTTFGVNLTEIQPGSWSSQRHWHEKEEEFVYILSGEAVLVTDAGEETLRAGDCVGFKANDRNGHCLQNRSNQPLRLLEIGPRVQGDAAHYPDIDLHAPANERPAMYCHTDGRSYENLRRRGPDDD